MNTKNSKPFRIKRVKEQIKKYIAEIIRTKIKDPRIGFITITDIDVTADYSFVTVYYTVLEEDKKPSTKIVLENAKGYLRKELGAQLHIYKIPELKFKYDISIDRSISLSHLIDQIVKNPD